jgi:hypothetical protein
MRVVWAFVFITCIWKGADCFSWKPSTNLPLASHCKRTATTANVHRHCRQLFARSQQARMVMSPQGEATSNVVEGPFQGQFGLWFVDSHDAQVCSCIFVDFVCDVILLSACLFLLQLYAHFVFFTNIFDQEVLVYRLSLLAAATSLSLGTFLALSTPNSIAEWSLDVCAVGFLASFGVSLTTIHIYMKPLHNMLKVELISVLIFIAVLSHQFCVKGALAGRSSWVSWRSRVYTIAPPCLINNSTP